MNFHNLAAWTDSAEPAGIYPQYVSINEVDGRVQFTVREPPTRAADGTPQCGRTVTATMSKDAAFTWLLVDLARSTGKLFGR